MASDSASQLRFDASALAWLACPACHGALSLRAGSVACKDCGRAYLVVDGIPVLIAERAIAAGN